MKRFFQLAMVLVLLTACDRSYNTLAINGLMGRVKTVKTTCYFTTGEEGDVKKDKLMDYIITDNYLSFYPISEAHYNKKGNVVKQVVYDNKHKLQSVIESDYIGNYRISNMLKDGKGKVLSSSEIAVEHGQAVGYQYYNSNFPSDYDVRECYFNGLQVESYMLYRDTIPSVQILYEYKNNMMSKSITKNLENSSTYIISQEWLSNGQLTSVVETQNNEEVLKINLEYDHKKLLVQYSRKAKMHDPEGYKFEYTSFDNKDNWLERVVYVNGKPLLVEQREIEYY